MVVYEDHSVVKISVVDIYIYIFNQYYEVTAGYIELILKELVYDKLVGLQ